VKALSVKKTYGVLLLAKRGNSVPKGRAFILRVKLVTSIYRNKKLYLCRIILYNNTL
jgi:hypothetical protein